LFHRSKHTRSYVPCSIRCKKLFGYIYPSGESQLWAEKTTYQKSTMLLTKSYFVLNLCLDVLLIDTHVLYMMYTPRHVSVLKTMHRIDDEKKSCLRWECISLLFFCCRRFCLKKNIFIKAGWKKNINYIVWCLLKIINSHIWQSIYIFLNLMCYSK